MVHKKDEDFLTLRGTEQNGGEFFTTDSTDIKDREQMRKR